MQTQFLWPWQCQMNLLLSGFEPETSITADLLQFKKKSPLCSKDRCVQIMRRPPTTEKYDVYDHDNAILIGSTFLVWSHLINVAYEIWICNYWPGYSQDHSIRKMSPRIRQSLANFIQCARGVRKMRRPPTIEKHDFYDHDNAICPHKYSSCHICLH